MTSPNQEQTSQEPAQKDKEYNFRQLEMKVAGYEKQLHQERTLREEAEKKASEALSRKVDEPDEEENDDEPYVDHRKLTKKLSSFEKKLDERIEKKAEERARAVIEKEKKEMWLKSNPDFFDVLQQNADKFAAKNPELAESILEMPDNFERQKLVYKNIKAMGLDKPDQRSPSVQDKIDANRRSPYYQPSGPANAPYSNGGDFSQAGQENAYKKMQELKNRLRI